MERKTRSNDRSWFWMVWWWIFCLTHWPMLDFLGVWEPRNWSVGSIYGGKIDVFCVYISAFALFTIWFGKRFSALVRAAHQHTYTTIATTSGTKQINKQSESWTIYTYIRLRVRIFSTKQIGTLKIRAMKTKRQQHTWFWTNKKYIVCIETSKL